MKDLIKRFAIWLAQGIIGALFIVIFAYLLVEWAAGCGESYVDSKGQTHTHPCVFISINK